MVLGELPVPGRPAICIIVGHGPAALAVGAGGVIWTFFFSSLSFLSSFSVSLGDGPVKTEICLKGPLSPKQPTIPNMKRYRFPSSQ